jgi:hypothetical protein
MTSIRPLFNYFPWVFQCLTLLAILILWIKPICCIGTARPYTRTSRRSQPKANGDKNLKKRNPASTRANTNGSSKAPTAKGNSKLSISSNSNRVIQNQDPEPSRSQVPAAIADSEEGGAVSTERRDLISQPIADTLSEDVYSSSLLIYSVLVTLLLVQVSTAGITPAITIIPYTVICLLGVSGDTSSSGKPFSCDYS